MRTKTILMSALLGAIGTVSAMAQTNVYSQNAVGYINVTIYSGYNLISCPLLTSPDQTLNTLFPNGTGTGGPYNGDTIYFFSAANGYSSTQGKVVGTGGTGWSAGASTNIISPGEGIWFFNAGATTNVTFVGTVPTGPMTNAVQTGYNLISSVVPMSGDLYSNSISAFTNVNLGDTLYVFDPTQQTYTFSYQTVNPTIAHNGGSPWKASAGGDPVIPNVGEAFFYFTAGSTINWVENYSVSQ